MFDCLQSESAGAVSDNQPLQFGTVELLLNRLCATIHISPRSLKKDEQLLSTGDDVFATTLGSAFLLVPKNVMSAGTY